MSACSIGCDNLSLKYNFFAVNYRISAVETVEYSLAVFFQFIVSKKCVFPLRKRNWYLKINCFARHDDTGPACSLFSFPLGFFFFGSLKLQSRRKRFTHSLKVQTSYRHVYCSYTHAKTLRVQSALPRSGSLL